MPERLQIRLLGGIEIVLDGRRLNAFHSLRLQRFLALIVLRDGPQHRAQLAFELWPDSSEAQARTNLRKLLHEFRKALPDADAFVEIDIESVLWRQSGPSVVDVVRFRRAFAAGDFEQAAVLYSGDLLPACYDEWVLEARAALRTDAQAAFTRLMEAAAGRGEPEATLRHARRVLELEPTDEAAHCQQIEAYLALGDRTAGLRAYHRYAEILEREFGVAPGEQVVALYRQIQGGLADPDGQVTPAPAPVREMPVATSPFIGRDRELAELYAAWTTVREGGARVVLVSGEPGIGKSRLALELGRRVQAEGHVVAAARAYEAAGRLPWGPVVDLLRSGAVRDRINELEPAWRFELARLLPELLDPDQPRPRSQAGDFAQRHRLFDAVRHALVPHDRPRLLIVDDLQWCDAETIELIGFIIRSDEAAPVLIVGTVRTEEVSDAHPLTRLVEALEHDQAVTHLSLDPLDEAATATLAARMQVVDSVDPAFAARLWAETTGNPLFVVETIRAGVSKDGPQPMLTPTMRAVLRSRLSQLSGGARRLSEMAAVFGRAFSIDLMAAATGIGEHGLIDAVDELWCRRIIREQGVRYDFSHDKLRAVALEMINPARLRLLHRAAAGAIAATHGDDPDAVSPQLAAHYDQAGMIGKAVEAYRTAGARAVVVSAFAEAVGLFRRALSLLAELPGSADRDRLELELRIALGSPLVALEGYGAERAHQLYERAQALCRKLGLPVHPPILRGLGLARLQGCRFAECDELGRALIDNEARDPIAVTEGRYLLGVSAFWKGDLAGSRCFLNSAIGQYDIAHRDRHLALYAQDPKAVCMVRLALAELWGGDPGRALGTARAAQELAEDLGHLMTLGYVITYAAMLAAEAEDFDRLEEVLADGSQLWKRFSMRYLSVLLEALRGWVDLRAGSHEGIDKIADAVERSRAEGENLHLTYTLLLLARAHEWLGNPQQARAAAQEGLSLSQEFGQLYLEGEFRRVEGELAHANGETVQAETALREAAAIAHEQGARWLELRALTSLARRDPKARTRLAAMAESIPSGHDLPAFHRAKELLRTVG